MGQVLSTLVQDVDDVITSIGKTVTDATKSVGQLTGIVDGFTKASQPATPALLQGRLPYRTSSVVIFSDAQDFNTALKGAVKSAKDAANKAFNAEWPDDSPAGTDSGIVASFNSSGDVTTILSQLKQDFTNWSLPLNDNQILQMAQTLQTQVTAQAGQAGVAHGTYHLNMNQSMVWVVTYGIFYVTQTTQGLVYAFTAALDSSF